MTTLEECYEAGVKQAMAEAGMLKEAVPLGAVRAAQESLRNFTSAVGRGAGGAVVGGTLGGLTGDEDSNLAARILAGAGVGAGLGVGSVPAENLIRKLIASGRSTAPIKQLRKSVR